MILVFLGPPGAGKGTQAKILEDRFGYRSISTGDILRTNKEQQTPLGIEAQGFMERGELVPDDLIIRMMELELANADDVIIDGFPRTTAQAQAFDSLLEAKKLKSLAIIFDVDYNVLIERITGRWTNPRTGRVYHVKFNPPKVAGIDDEDGGPLVQRPDDNEEVVTKRLQEYEQKTAPLIGYYERTGDTVHVNALGEIKTVTESIITKLPDGGPELRDKHGKTPDGENP